LLSSIKKTDTTVPIVNPSIHISRISSVDVYRGFVMLLMMAEVLSLKTVAKALPNNSFWQFLADQQTHVSWAGCGQDVHCMILSNLLLHSW
jgi:hypothetical protein